MVVNKMSMCYFLETCMPQEILIEMPRLKIFPSKLKQFKLLWFENCLECISKKSESMRVFFKSMNEPY